MEIATWHIKSKNPYASAFDLRSHVHASYANLSGSGNFLGVLGTWRSNRTTTSKKRHHIGYCLPWFTFSKLARPRRTCPLSRQVPTPTERPLNNCHSVLGARRRRCRNITFGSHRPPIVAVTNMPSEQALQIPQRPPGLSMVPMRTAE